MQTQNSGFGRIPTAEEASFFKKDKPHKKSATSEKTLGIRGQTRKVSIIHDCQMPPSLRPRIYSALERDCPLAPAPLPVVRRFHRPGSCSNPETKPDHGCGRQIQLLLEHPLSSPAGGRTPSLTAHLREPRWPLRNEMCLWGDLMHPVVCWVGRRFIVADGHLMPAKLSPLSPQANIKDLRGICSKVF